MNTDFIRSVNWLITDRCNSFCGHCDIWQSRSERSVTGPQARAFLADPLIQRSYDFYGDDFDIAVGGGEPFTSAHLDEVVQAIQELTPGALKTISTNGLLTNEIIFFLKKYNHLVFKLNISVDGLKKTHDAIRGKRGFFEQTLGTVLKVRKFFPQRRIELKFTLIPENYDEIYPVYRLARRMGCGFVFKPAENIRSYTNRRKSVCLDFSCAQKCVIRNQAFLIADEFYRNGDFKKARFLQDIPFYLFYPQPAKGCSVLKDALTIRPDGACYSCLKGRRLGSLTWESAGSVWLKKERAIKSGCPGCMLMCGSFKGYSDEPFKKHVANIETTLRCNCDCGMCTQAAIRNTLVDMTIDRFASLIENNSALGHVSFVGGEPFLNKDFFKMMHLCDRKRITYEITTNGTMLSQSALDRLKSCAGIKKINFSLDGAAAVHDRIRGRGVFRKCFKAMKACDSFFNVGVNSVLRHDNIAGLPALSRLISRHGIKEQKFISAVHFSDKVVRMSREALPGLKIRGEVFSCASRIETKDLRNFLNSVIDISKSSPLLKIGWEPSASRPVPGESRPLPVRCRQLGQYRFDPSGQRIICEFFRNRYDLGLVARIIQRDLPICRACCKNDLKGSPLKWVEHAATPD
ncbi:MAG: radical SAM protein [Candidatus Omnitrophota bacterium]|nr:radical SAM protein [Candidatus Omnitrophota bacterium]